MKEREKKKMMCNLIVKKDIKKGFKKRRKLLRHRMFREIMYVGGGSFWSAAKTLFTFDK